MYYTKAADFVEQLFFQTECCMFKKLRYLSFITVIFVCFAACTNSGNTRSWLGTYYYEICCNKGASSEYWSLVLNDSAGHVSALLYFGAGTEKAVVHCDLVGDSAHLDVVMNQKSDNKIFKSISLDEVLFTLNRQADSTIVTVWKAVHPQCSDANIGKGICFTTAQPGTINDPCAGENAEATQSSTDQTEVDGGADVKIDTAEVRFAFSDGTTQSMLSAEALQILQNGAKMQIYKSFDEAHKLTKLSDKNIETADCFSVGEGGTVSLHVTQPLPTFIVSGSSKSADAEHRSRIKSIDILWEFEKVGHIELIDAGGMQYLKQLDDLRTNGPENGLEIEITAYPTSSEVCIAEFF